MNVRSNIGICFFLILSGLPVNLSGRVSIEHITSSNGISNNAINVIIQDSRGFIWIGTDDGLNRYDGYTYITFRHNIHDTCSISSSMIYALSEDGEGNIWAGTSAGISRYDPVSDRFTNYSFFPSLVNRQANEVMEVVLDESGQVWALLRDHLVSLEPATGEFKTFPLDAYVSDLTLSYRTSMFYQPGNQLLFIGTEKGLKVFDPITEEWMFSGLDGKRVHCIVGSADSSIWIGTSGGLVILPEILGQPDYDGMQWFMEHTSVRDMMVDRRGRMLLLTGEQLMAVQPGNSGAGFTTLVDLSGSHGNTAPRLFLLDRSQTCWIGTHAGLLRKDLKPRRFDYYSTESENEINLHSRIISSIMETENELFIGSWGGGLEILDLRDHSATWFHFSGTSHFYPERGVNVIHRDPAGATWIAGDDLYRFFRNRAEFKSSASVFHDYKGDPIAHSRIYDIVNINADRMVATHEHGIYFIDHQHRTVKNETVIRLDTFDLPVYQSTSAAFDGENLWIGCASGILRHAPADSSYTLFATDSDCGLAGNILTLMVDSRGYLWAGTPSGLFRFNASEGIFQGYSVKDGLANDFIYSIEEDQDGLLWMGTNMGIASFDPAENTFRNYGINDGLSTMEFNLQASYFSKQSGRMYFGSIDGVNFFYPDSMQRESDPPRIEITGFTIFNREKGVQPAPARSSLMIRDDESVQVTFSVMDFSKPSLNEYAYRLAGKKDHRSEWTPIGTDNSVILSGLKHGHYRFEVSGFNSEGIPTENIAAASLAVRAPIQRRKIFLWLMFLPFLILVYFLFEYRTKTLRQSNRALREKEVAAKEVLKQKNLLSQRNKSIEDSLKYAQRIQSAMFTSAREIHEMFPSSFILQKPKDIVSGDFYWAKKVDSKIFLAAVDCTGHGVPGAFMSLIGIEFFRQAITVENVFTPSEVLNQLNQSFDQLFDSVQDLALKDGMDVSLCAFDTSNQTLEFSGAFNPLYILRDDEIIEIKGDKNNIGPYIGFDRKPFTNHRVELQPDDVIYMFSDGFVDQFGGPEGKKFKYRRFRHLLLSMHDKPMRIQKQILENSIDEWKGNLEQVDDILVIGVRPYSLTTRKDQTSRSSLILETRSST